MCATVTRRPRRSQASQMAEGGAVALVPNRAARPILLRLAAKPETTPGILIRKIQTGIRWCEKEIF